MEGGKGVTNDRGHFVKGENMREEKESRTVDVNVVGELRVIRKANESPKIVGHAAVFNSPTFIEGFFGGFNEEVAPGAFKESIENDDVRALFNHDPNLILGRNKSGTLTLSEDEKGLRYEIDPPDNSAGRDALESIERGDVDGSSFGFRVEQQTWTENDGDEPDHRLLQKVKLFDVSPVTFPAYPDTDVAKRQHQEFRAARGTDTKDIWTDETRPYPNEHSCRLREPDEFKPRSFVRIERESDGKKYDVIMGRLKGETTLTEQAYRYDKETWTVSEARKHCNDHDGILFEPAEETKSDEPIEDPAGASCCGIESKKDSPGKSGDDNEFRPNREQMGRRLRLED